MVGGYIVSLLDQEGNAQNHSVSTLGHVFELVTGHLSKVDALTDADHETVKQAVRALRHKKAP